MHIMHGTQRSAVLICNMRSGVPELCLGCMLFDRLPHWAILIRQHLCRLQHV
eukprot:COSAG01_NODE_74558_length_208_cov_381.733945_1_plen_51_part_01